MTGSGSFRQNLQKNSRKLYKRVSGGGGGGGGNGEMGKRHIVTDIKGLSSNDRLKWGEVMIDQKVSK